MFWVVDWSFASLSQKILIWKKSFWNSNIAENTTLKFMIQFSNIRFVLVRAAVNVNKTIEDGGITLNFWIIKFHTLIWNYLWIFKNLEIIKNFWIIRLHTVTWNNFGTIKDHISIWNGDYYLFYLDCSFGCE